MGCNPMNMYRVDKPEYLDYPIKNQTTSIYIFERDIQSGDGLFEH